MIGSGGAGKTTFAHLLAERLQLPLIHLDALYWRPGWEAPPNEEWDRTIEALVARDAWVMDGNYGRTLSVRLLACDSVVFLDLPRIVCVWRLLRRRVIYRGRGRPDLPAECPERLSWDFVWWVWTYPQRRRPDVLRQLASLAPDKRVVVLRSSRAVREYLQRLE